MILSKILPLKIVKKSVFSNVSSIQCAFVYNRARIGNREWVGYGTCGQATYMDNLAFPMPAIRWKENNNELSALREKEKGDWRKLSLEEKKTLYRASFCQTFSEVYAPTGEWKYVTGGTLIGLSIGIFVFILIKLFVGPPKPASQTEEHRAKLLRALLDLKIGGAVGTSSKWDYEKDDWK